MKNNPFKSCQCMGIFIAVTGCAGEMHPADSAPAPTALQSSAGGPAAAPAVQQPVQVRSGLPGINPPTRSQRAPGAADSSLNSTTVNSSNGNVANTSTTGTSAGGTGSTLR